MTTHDKPLTQAQALELSEALIRLLTCVTNIPQPLLATARAQIRLAVTGQADLPVAPPRIY